MNNTELRNQIKQYAEQLSPERLQVATDFLAYLVERESNEATEKLLTIPGFNEMYRKAKKDITEGKLTDWRKIRNDV